MNFDDILKSIISYKKLHFKYRPQYVNYFVSSLINFRHFSFCCLCQHVPCVMKSVRTQTEHFCLQTSGNVSVVLNTFLFYKFTHDDIIKCKNCPRYWPLCGEVPRTKASDAELRCFFDLRLNEWLSTQWCGWWCEKPSCLLWRHSNVLQLNSPQGSAPTLHWLHVNTDAGKSVMPFDINKRYRAIDLPGQIMADDQMTFCKVVLTRTDSLWECFLSH